MAQGHAGEFSPTCDHRPTTVSNGFSSLGRRGSPSHTFSAASNPKDSVAWHLCAMRAFQSAIYNNPSLSMWSLNLCSSLLARKAGSGTDSLFLESRVEDEVH